jgi:hypothetical protein
MMAAIRIATQVGAQGVRARACALSWKAKEEEKEEDYNWVLGSNMLLVQPAALTHFDAT